MRLLIAKLASAAAHSVSVAMNSEHDIADVATDLESCQRLLRGSPYDLVVLILGHGRIRTPDAIARMRREAGNVPLVVLTHLDETEPVPIDAVRRSGPRVGPDHAEGERGGFERDAADLFDGETPAAGWPDYPEPIGAAAARALPGTEPAAGQPTPLSLEPETGTVRLSGHPLPLSQAEYRIFATLWERRGDIIPAKDLLEAVYRDGARPSSRVLPVFLFKLRKKLRHAGLGDMIETAVGRGFTIRQPP